MSRRINLNKNWLFLKEACAVEELTNKEFSAIDIPHTWNAIDGQNGGDNYHRGLCWYKKTFTLHEDSDNRVYIEFEAVNSVANVYLNGEHLGEHRGGYSTFRFDITDRVIDGENTIIVGADNSHIEDVYPLFADFTFYGGIYRDVNLVVTEPLHFEQLNYGSSGVFVTQKSVNESEAQLEIKAQVINSAAECETELKVVFKDADGNTVSEGKNSISINSSGEMVVDLTVTNPILWQGRENPYLYSCEVSLWKENTLCDSITIPTGLRYFTFDGDKGFYLNGIKTRLNGVSRHQDREAVGNALTKEHQIQDMELIKEVGANSIRLAHYQHNSFFYDLCDQAGMVVWAEIPYISRTSKTDQQATNAKEQMHELVKQNYNHPSIIMWGVQNEIGMFPDERPLDDIAREIHDVVKESDTSRVTTQAQVMMIKEDDPANYVTDTVAFNQYHGWYVGDTSGYDSFIQKFIKANPGKSLGYSEYGAEGIITLHSDDPKVKDYTEEYHAKYHEEVMAIFNKYDCIWGTYVWNMFDFGSDMRDEGGVKGRNNKGLVTFDRSIKKDAFFFYKSLWNPEKMIHIASKRFIDRHTEFIDVKVYSNLDSLTLSLNGEVRETKTSEGNIFIFRVILEEGLNLIAVKGDGLSDSVTFNKVDEPNISYQLPESEKKKGIVIGADDNVKNWFDDEIVEVGEFLFPEDKFSIKDKISEIIANSKGEELMRKFFGNLLDSDKAEMMIGFPLELVLNFDQEAFSEGMKYKLNCELNNITK